MRIEKISTIKNPPNRSTPKKDTAHKKAPIKDEYIPSQKEKNNETYDQRGVKVDTNALNKAVEAANRAHSQLRTIVKRLLERQGLSFREAFALEKNGELDLEIDELAQQEAAEMIAEGGEYSVEAVSDRIVDFAKAISGGDTAKLETLKEAIDEGFTGATKALGGSLPEISNQTYDRVMEKLDEWAKAEE